MKRGWVVPVAIAIWLAAVGTGMTALTRYKSTPGTSGEIAQHWPAASTISRTGGVMTLVMTVHPKCVCTRASIDELAVLLARAHRKVEPVLLFIRPEGAEPSWTQSDTWASALRLPGARVIEDPGGVESRRFGAETSGHAFVFDGDGALVFQGGLTGSRGHEGSNAGLDRALGIVDGETVVRADSPVFGCAMFDQTLKGGE